MAINPIDLPNIGQHPWGQDLNAALSTLNLNLGLLDEQVGDIDERMDAANDAADRAEQAAQDIENFNPLEGVIDGSRYGFSSTGDMTPVLAAALADVPDGGTLLVPKGEYRVSTGSAVVVDRNISIDFQGATFINGRSSGPAIRFLGFDGETDHAYGTPVPASNVSSVTLNPASDGSGWISADTPGTSVELSSAPEVKRGDWVKIVSDDPIMGARDYYSTSDLRRARYGQHLQVYAVEGNTVICFGALREIEQYVTNVRVAKVIGASLSVSNLVVSMSDAGWDTENASRTGLEFNGLIRPRIRNVRIERSHGGAISFTNCFQYDASDIQVNMTRNRINSPDPTNYANTYGYGIIDVGSQEGTIRNFTAGHVRHAFTDDASRSEETNRPVRAYGRTYGTRIIDSSCRGSSSASWDTHAHGDSVQFINCSSFGSAGGFSLRGINHVIRGGLVQDSSRQGVQIRGESPRTGWSWGHTISDVLIDGAQNGILISHNEASGATDPVIRDASGRALNGPTGTRVEVPDVVRGVKIRRLRAIALLAENSTVEVDDFSFEMSANEIVSGGGYVQIQNSLARMSNLRGDIRFAPMASVALVSSQVNSELSIDGFNFLWGSTDPRGIIESSTQTTRCINGYCTRVVPTTLNQGGSVVSYVTYDGQRPGSPPPFVEQPTTGTNYFRNAFNDIQCPTITYRWARPENSTVPNFHTPVVSGQQLLIINEGGGTVTVNHGSASKTVNLGGTAVVLQPGEKALWVGVSDGRWHQVY